MKPKTKKHAAPRRKPAAVDAQTEVEAEVEAPVLKRRRLVLRKPSAAESIHRDVTEDTPSASSDDQPVSRSIEPQPLPAPKISKNGTAANFFDRPNDELTAMTKFFPQGIPDGLPPVRSERFKGKRKIISVTSEDSDTIKFTCLDGSCFWKDKVYT
jgi:hypothetical protein